jgi:hypothetical protein
MGLGRQRKSNKQINRYLKRHEPITKWKVSWAEKMVFKAGIDAFFAGLSLNQCPHKAPQPWETWRRGYFAARQTYDLVRGN